MGLYFRRIRFPLCLLVAADSSHGTKETAYANDGLVVLLAHDDLVKEHRIAKYTLTEEDAAKLGGVTHVTGSYGRKAKRVSYSTSQGETTGAAGGQEFAQMIATRYSEVFYGKEMSLTHTIQIWERGLYVIPIDHLTDCADFFELACGERTMPQDKAQKLYITSFREMRLVGKIRRFLLIPTESMVADALTKAIKPLQIWKLLTSGAVRFENTAKHPITQRMLSRQQEFTEKDLSDLSQFEQMD